jgi:hypothetical protein
MNKYAQIIQELKGEFIYHSSGRERVPVTQTDLDAVEKRIGYTLPPDYREFLQDFGAYRVYASFSISNPPQELRGGADVYVFYGLNAGYSVDLIELFEDNLLNSVIAPDLLPISGCEVGQACIFLDGPRIGQVYFWYREEVFEGYDYSNLYFIANSFDDFIKNLRLIED